METPTGMRDFAPDEQRIRLKLKKIIEDVFVRYGYEPLDTPAMEFLEVLTAKSGEEVKEQIFLIEGEDIGLRFDLTVPLARFASSKLELKKPFKRYVIAKVWRNEEPQKARFREFIQADADIIGVSHPSAEVELLHVALDALKALGLEVKEENFLINDREFLFSFAKAKGIKDSVFFRAIDKLDKIGKEGVLNELKPLGKVAIEAFEELSQERDNEEALDFIAKYSEKAYERLVFIEDYFRATVKLNLVRGLDYYTGPIFECKVSDEIGSISAGGRYDNLLGVYGNSDYAVGISLGFERIYYLLRDKMMEEKRRRGIFVAFVEVYDYAFSIAQQLRKKFIVDMGFVGKSLKKQLEYADKKGYKYVIIVGPKEKERNEVVLKNLEEGKEFTLKLNELAKWIENGGS